MAAAKGTTKRATKPAAANGAAAKTIKPVANKLVSDGTPINIGLTEEQRRGVAEVLTVHLANAHVLYIKTRNYHWNVQSRRFAELHEFFEEQYDQIAEGIDEIAERVRQLGIFAPGTMAEFLQLATLKEEPGVYPDPQTMIAKLLADHEAIIRALREDVEKVDDLDDEGTTDFLTGMMEAHEKMAWMLRAHLVDAD